MLRTDDIALRLVQEVRSHGVLITSLCHGPQVIISAAAKRPTPEALFPKGTHITGVASIRVDLVNAGFNVHESDPTVYDAASQLLTGRDPNDLGPLCQEMGRLLRERLERRNG